MGSSPKNRKNSTETTSTQPRGGCFTAIFSPLIILFGLLFTIQIFTGETTRPWDLISEAIPVSAHAVEAESAPTISSLAPFFAPSVQYWEKEILRWAADWELDPNLIATVMQIESCGDPRALSYVGAMGLFQVMPYHFSPEEAPYNPETNAKRGMAYLSQALNTYQDIRLAFAGYNGGIGTAAKHETNWPQETIRYTC
jgi:soluble lytic murein transglycosylase-like protein